MKIANETNSNEIRLFCFATLEAHVSAASCKTLFSLNYFELLENILVQFLENGMYFSWIFFDDINL
jgi:hypothetical protein